MKNLFAPPSLQDLLRLLRAWRFWLAGALMGAMLGAGAYTLFPPEYRATATIVIDFNAEEAWDVESDKELFYFLERETRKLEELAWAETTLQQVAQETGYSLPQLQTKLQLSQPEDGGWHFNAQDPNPQIASQLASAWARTFASQTRAGIQTAIQLRAALRQLEENPADPNLPAKIEQFQAQSLGITPEMQISEAQPSALPTQRKTPLEAYLLGGAFFFLSLSALLVLFAPPPTRHAP